MTFFDACWLRERGQREKRQRRHAPKSARSPRPVHATLGREGIAGTMSNPARPGERHTPACSDAGCCSLPLMLVAVAVTKTDAGADAAREWEKERERIISGAGT